MAKDKNNQITETEDLYCSFCGKSKTEVFKLVAGPKVYICNECITTCSDIIRDECQDLSNPEDLNGEYIHELLEEHFEPMKLESIISFSYLFPINVCKKLQETIDELLKSQKIKFKFVGIGRQYSNARIELNFSELWERRHYPFFVGPIQYKIAEFSESLENRCLKNGLWLCASENVYFAIYLDYRIVEKQFRRYLPGDCCYCK